MSGFVKDGDQQFSDQLNNFKDKLPSYQTALGLEVGVVNAVKDDAVMMAFAVSAIGSAKSYTQGWTSLKDSARKGDGTTPIADFPTPVDVSSPPTAVAPGIEDRFRALVRQIKANSNYTEAMGEDLGIIAPEDTTTLGAPELKIEMKGGNPVISFVKSKSDGIRLYGKRGTETTFAFLAVDTRSPYTDSRPNETPGTPEPREYYAYYIQRDEQVGSQSAVISINMG